MQNQQQQQPSSMQQQQQQQDDIRAEIGATTAEGQRSGCCYIPTVKVTVSNDSPLRACNPFDENNHFYYCQRDNTLHAPTAPPPAAAPPPPPSRQVMQPAPLHDPLSLYHPPSSASAATQPIAAPATGTLLPTTTTEDASAGRNKETPEDSSLRSTTATVNSSSNRTDASLSERAKQQAAKFMAPDARTRRKIIIRNEIQAMFWELFHFARNRSWKKKIMTLLVACTSIYVVTDLFFLGHVQQLIEICLTWMTKHPFGAVFSFVGFFVVATFCFVPATLVMFAAGYGFANMLGSFGWGVLAASGVCFAGSCIGALFAFLRSRYMMREVILIFCKRYPIVKAADAAFERNGFKVMLLLRLCPIIPFNGLNYIGGVLNISLEDYLKALVGTIPTIILWCYVGATAESLSNRTVDGQGEQIYMGLLMGAGVIFGLIALVLVWRYAMEELEKEIERDSAECWWKYRETDEDGAPIEMGTEHTLDEFLDYDEFHNPTVFNAIGLGKVGMLSFYSKGPKDDRDEDWFWLWS